QRPGARGPRAPDRPGPGAAPSGGIRGPGAADQNAHPGAPGTRGGTKGSGARRDRRAELHNAHRPRRPRRRGRERAYHRDAGGAGMTKTNPITVEDVRNAINAYADEMATALCKSAYNMMIYEVRDF